MSKKTRISKLAEYITEELQTKGKHEIRGVGTLKVKHLEAYNQYNPYTKQVELIPAHKKVSFKQSRIIKAKLNENLTK